MATNKLTQAEYDKIQELSSQNWSATEIAQEIGRGKSLVYRTLREIQGPKIIWLNRDKDAEIRDAYQSGWSASALAKCHNVTHHTIIRSLKRSGVTIRQSRLGNFDNQETIQVLELWDQGVPIETIREIFNTSLPSLHKMLKEAERDIKRTPIQRGGGRHKDGHGYVRVWIANDSPFYSMSQKSYVSEHRLIMAEHLGRLLTKQETIHHKNGVRDDNRLENLQLRTGNHGSGIKLSCADCGSRNLKAEELE